MDSRFVTPAGHVIDPKKMPRRELASRGMKPSSGIRNYSSETCGVIKKAGSPARQ